MLRRLRGSRRTLAVVGAMLVVVVAGVTTAPRLLWSPPPLFPVYGTDIGELTRTCRAATIGFTPITGRECRTWENTGPVNVVIVFTNRDAFAELTHATDGRWRAAQGNWLVAQGYTREAPKGCDDGWRDSSLQAENRIDGTTRRHLKLVYMTCTQDDGTTVAFGDAHTDRYDLTNCGGDSLAGFSDSLDAVIAAFRADSHAHVEVRSVGRPTTYPSCNHAPVVDDGRVAFISIDD